MATNVTNVARGIVSGTYKCKNCNSVIHFQLPISASATSNRMGIASRDAREGMIDSAKSASREALFETRKMYHEEINIKKRFELFTTPFSCPNCNQKAEWSEKKNPIMIYVWLLFYLAYYILWVLATGMSFVPKIVFPIIGIFILIARIVLSTIEIVKRVNRRKTMTDWDAEWFPIIENEYGHIPDLSRYNIPAIINNSLNMYAISVVKPEICRMMPVLVCGIICVSKVIKIL